MPTDLPTDLPPAASDVAVEDGTGPYGFLGLVLSLIAILLVAAAFCLILAAAAFGLSGLRVGWHATLERIIDLDSSMSTDESYKERLAVIASMAVYAAMSASVLLAARVRGGRRWRDLIAWRAWSPVRGARLFWALAAFILLYSLAADAAIAHFDPKFQDIVHMPKGTTWIVLFIALATVFAPITEELLFRGWLYTSLRESIGVPAGILVTAVLFALAHWEATHLYALAVFPVGLALGFLRERTGSIKSTMTFHAFYNGAASVLLLFAQ